MKRPGCQCADADCKVEPCVSAGHAGDPGVSAEYHGTDVDGNVSLSGDYGRCLSCHQPLIFPWPNGVSVTLHARGRATPPLLVPHATDCDRPTE